VNILDLAIIYLACGAPFAVNYSFRADDTFGFVELVKSFGVGVAWPYFALMMLYTSITAPKKHSADELAARRVIESVRHKLESHIASSMRPNEIFEFRDAVMRYAGLKVAEQMPTGNAPEMEFIAITYPQPNAAAAAIFERKHKARIEFHSYLAGCEFVDTINALSHHKGLAAAAAQIAEDLDDNATADIIRGKDTSQAIAAFPARAA